MNLANYIAGERLRQECSAREMADLRCLVEQLARGLAVAPKLEDKLHRSLKEERLAIGNSETISQDIASVDVSQLPMAQFSPPSATLAKMPLQLQQSATVDHRRVQYGSWR
jgi:hypothetical protein